jgi:hypothetical protein
MPQGFLKQRKSAAQPPNNDAVDRPISPSISPNVLDWSNFRPFGIAAEAGIVGNCGEAWRSG